MTAGRVWKLWAYQYPSGLMHVGPKSWVALHAFDDPLVPVLAEEILAGLYEPAVTHYGWADKADPANDPPSMIQVRCEPSDRDPREDRALLMLDMCFPYGLKRALANNEGAVVPLRIVIRDAEPEEV